MPEEGLAQSLSRLRARFENQSKIFPNAHLDRVAQGIAFETRLFQHPSLKIVPRGLSRTSLLGGSRGALGRSLNTLGALLGALGTLLGALGTLLGRSWAVLARSWALLERSWALLERSWTLLGRSWALLGRS